MVFVPILKIDLPEPRLQELLPSAVNGLLGACTLLCDAVHDYLKPLSPAGQAALYESVITNLPREFRRARKRIVEMDIRDDDKISEELEDASFAFYRRKLREDVCGYSDEDTEDVTFRRLLSPESATRDIYGQLPGQELLDDAAQQYQAQLAQLLQAQQQEGGGQAQQQPQQPQEIVVDLRPARQRQAAAAAAAAAAIATVPSGGRRAATTAATGGAGLALGVGVVKLAQFVARQLSSNKGKRKGGRKRGSAQSSRRTSEAGSVAGSRGGSRRTTPRQR